MKKILSLLILSVVLVSCSIEIQPIEYGHDACEHCSMTIVEHTHAAQIVTDKGKNFKFDATECMINYLAEKNNENDMEHILSTDYLNPGVMLNATESTFLISEEIPSPMGAYLSAIKDENAGKELLEEVDGDLYNWEEIKEVINNLPKYNHHSSHNEHSNH